MDDIIKKAEQYKIDATYNGRAHYKAVEIASKKGNLIGVPAVVASSIVATSIFATLNTNPQIEWKLATGFLSIATAILSALQTFFKFSDKAEKHRVAGAKYSGLRRNIEHFILTYSGKDLSAREDALKEIKLIGESLTKLAEDSFPVPQKAYDLAIKEISEESGVIPTSVGNVHDEG